MPDYFLTLPGITAKGGPVAWDYEKFRVSSSLVYYMKVKLALPVAQELAAGSPYPDAVNVGMMKQVANDGVVTLEQMRILLGWAARRSQHTGR